MKSKKRATHVKVPSVAKNLDYYIDNLQEPCEKCGQVLKVHAFRQKSHNKSQAVYAACHNKGVCARYGLEICFIEKAV